MIDHFVEEDLSASRDNPAEAGDFFVDPDIIIGRTDQRLPVLLDLFQNDLVIRF
jgi:hypothetical protein